MYRKRVGPDLYQLGLYDSQQLQHRSNARYVAREYGARDHRIRIHCNETFVRVILNYNIAIRQISPHSKYCKVIAAGDWLYPECLEKMVGFAEEHSTVAIIG